MVPVLSVHNTVAEPSASTVWVCLTITPCCINRQAPKAINEANATGISSGRTDMAMVNPLSKLSKISRD